MVFIKLEESGYIYFEISVFYFSLLKGSTIHQELEMNRFSPYRNTLALPGKRSAVVGQKGGTGSSPGLHLLLGDKRAQRPGERRTEILPRPWVYSRVKVRQCRPREEIKTGKAKNTGLPPCWSGPASLSPSGCKGGFPGQEAGRRKRE